MTEIKTALVLGGGGSRGAYEIGVWQALRELGIHIDIVTGTSVGAINGALIAQDAFDLAVSLWKEIETDMVFDLDVKDILSQSGVGTKGLKGLLDQYIDEDLVRRSKTAYGLVTVEVPAMTPNYLMIDKIPAGKLADFIIASSSLFPALKTHEIDRTKFIDGGYVDNLPVGMALDQGATHILAVDLEVIGIIPTDRFEEAHYLKVIRCAWDLGNFLLFDKKNAKKIMRLGYLDTLKAFHVYDGHFYCFAKGEWEKRGIKNGDLAGKVFELNPEYIYTKQVFNDHLKRAIAAHLAEIDKDALANSKGILAKIIEGIEKTKSRLGTKTITLTIARSFKDVEPEKNIFLTKPAIKLLKDEISAANYLIKEGLIE